MAVRTRLTLVYAGVLAVLLAAFGWSAYRLLAAQLDAANSADLRELTDGLHGYLRFEDGRPVFRYDTNDPGEASFIANATRFYQLYDVTTGELIVQSPAMEPLALKFTPEEVHDFSSGEGVRELQTDQGRLRFSSTVVRPARGHAYLLQVGVLLRGMDRALSQFFRLLLWSIPVVVIVVALVGRWMAAGALLPMRGLATVARSIGVEALDRRMPVRGVGDELDQVASAFNETLERLERSVGEMRQFSAALAHELRAPLAAMRAEIETMLMRPRTPAEYQHGLGAELEEIDKLSRMVSQLLTLAQAEAGEIQLRRDRVDLGELAQSLTSQLEVVAEAKGVTLRCRADRGAVTLGDAGWIERLALNLIDNAIKFTPAGGTVTVEAAASEAHARLTVSDTGVGIPALDVPRVFERFYRADSSRSPQVHGTGLGLTLAKWIADRHQATIRVESREHAGTTVSVEFAAVRS